MSLSRRSTLLIILSVVGLIFVLTAGYQYYALTATQSATPVATENVATSTSPDRVSEPGFVLVEYVPYEYVDVSTTSSASSTLGAVPTEEPTSYEERELLSDEPLDDGVSVSELQNRPPQQFSYEDMKIPTSSNLGEPIGTTAEGFPIYKDNSPAVEVLMNASSSADEIPLVEPIAFIPIEVGEPGSAPPPAAGFSGPTSTFDIPDMPVSEPDSYTEDGIPIFMMDESEPVPSFNPSATGTFPMSEPVGFEERPLIDQ